MKIGIVGSGQLAKMLSLAAWPMNISTVALKLNDADENYDFIPYFPGSCQNLETLGRFIDACDIVTFETENVTKDVLEYCRAKNNVAPLPTILHIAQNRLREKQLFLNLKVPTTAFSEVSSYSMLKEAIQKLGYPAILKTQEGGYDGKGQYLIKDKADIEKAWLQLQATPLILEAFVPYQYEVSLIGVRNSKESRFYPLTKNTHLNGILYYSEAPYLHPELQEQAEHYMRDIFSHLDYKGVLTIEFFVTQQGELVANEMAPRVHNSGHWTIEGAYTSQFQNHIRAIADMPLGSCQARGFTAMFNFIGTIPNLNFLPKQDKMYLHDYGKKAKMNRKLGHLTILADSQLEIAEKISELISQIKFNHAYE